MTAFQHITVLREEAAALLATRPGVRVLDGTLGGGGHSEALLEKGATVIGLDQDPRALAAATERLAKYGDRFTAVHSNFRDSRKALDSLGIQRVDGVLVDLGVSSPQLDEADRGFSFARGGPLDMRMDTTQGRPLSQWLKESELHEIERAIRVYGEEQFARNIAKSIKKALEVGEIEDTKALAELVSHSIPRAQWPRTIHPATKTFQALRIAVNDELGALEAWLEALPSIVEVGGRAAAIAFHSLEDRPVKQAFAALTKGCICPPELPFCGCGKTAGWKLVTRKPIVASITEIENNARSRSAHLRCIERVSLES